MNRILQKVFLVALSGLTAFLLSACGEDHSHHHSSLPGAEIGPGSIYDLDLSFTNRTGAATQLKGLAGAPLVFSMIYTRCDSICPIQAANMRRVQIALPASDRKRVQFLLMSFDPEDRPEDLADFGKKMGLDSNWTLLTGDPDRVRELAAALGFQYRKNPKGDFSHSAAIYLLNEKGEVTYRREGTGSAPADFVERIKAL